MPDGIRIIKQETDFDYDEQSRPVEVVRVTFKIDADGPFTKKFPREGFTAIAARAALEAFAAEIRSLRS